MRRKRIINCMLAMLFVVAQIFGTTGIVYADGQPIVEIVNQEIPEGVGGREITIPITVRNTSNYYAKKIKITPVLDGEDNPFITKEMYLTKEIDKLAGSKEATVSFKFKVKSNAEPKIYPLKLRMSLLDAHNNYYEGKDKLIYVDIKQVHIPARVVVQNVTKIPATPKAGENFDLNLELYNEGTLAAQNVSVQLLENDNFAVVDSFSQKNFVRINGMNSEKINFKLQPKKDLSTDVYRLELKYSYENENNEIVENTQGLYVPVESEFGSFEAPELTITDVKTVESVEAGKTFKIQLKLNNEGIAKAKNVRVSMIPDEQSIYPVTQNKFIVGDLEGQSSQSFEFNFSSSTNLKTTNYPIKVNVDYDVDKETQSIGQYVGVLINSKSSNSTKTVPKIIISHYVTEPKMVNAGENFDLTLNFQNTNSDKEIRNLKITLRPKEYSKETGDTVFSPVDSSNTMYFDRIGPGEIVTKKLKMFTIPDALAKNYELESNFEYEYDSAEGGESTTMTDVIGIQVVQPARLEIADIQPPMEAYVGEPAYLTVEFYNMGRVKLNNLMVKTEGDFTVRDGNYFAGNFEQGNSDYYEPALIAEEPGAKTGKVIFQFEDPTGKEITIEKEFTVNFMEQENEMMMGGEEAGAFPDDMGMGMEEQNEKKPNKWVIIGSIVGGIVVLAIVISIVIKKRKKRKGLTFNEDI